MTEPGIGHNTASSAQLKSLIERIERLADEKQIIAVDISDVYAEAKGQGFDTKAMRAIVKLRREDADKRREHEALVETYMHALGMLSDTPLGQSAIARAAGPPAKLPDVDTSDRPFGAPPDDDMRVAEPA